MRTPRELVADLPLGPGDPRQTYLCFRLHAAYLADHLYEVCLNSGERVSDATAFKVLLHELADEARIFAAIPQSTKVIADEESGTRSFVMRPTPPRPQPRWGDTCHRCGHVHQGDAECGESLGGGRVCRCELDLRA
jgi:hypothetical protein